VQTGFLLARRQPALLFYPCGGPRLGEQLISRAVSALMLCRPNWELKNGKRISPNRLYRLSSDV
jgi:hypothetical protein